LMQSFVFHVRFQHARFSFSLPLRNNLIRLPPILGGLTSPSPHRAYVSWITFHLEVYRRKCTIIQNIPYQLARQTYHLHNVMNRGLRTLFGVYLISLGNTWEVGGKDSRISKGKKKQVGCQVPPIPPIVERPSAKQGVKTPHEIHVNPPPDLVIFSYA
jgi:hypothetical protein